MSEILCKADYEKAIETTRDARMAWFREARFGMFIHYGLYALYGRNEWVMALENESMVLVLELIARASLMREESRGAMYRRDYPETDNGEWLKNIIVNQADGRAVLRTQPVVTNEVPLPEREKVPYMIPTWEFDKRF